MKKKSTRGFKPGRGLRPWEEKDIMPLYDCMLLVKARVKKEEVMQLMARVGRGVFQRNGVITDLKSFGKVPLAYGIKKLDGRHFEGQFVQMTLMAPPSFPQELHYLNKEDRLLRWLVRKHRHAVYGLDFLTDHNDSDSKELIFKGEGERESDSDSEFIHDDDDDDDDTDEIDDYEDEDDGGNEKK